MAYIFELVQNLGDAEAFLTQLDLEKVKNPEKMEELMKLVELDAISASENAVGRQ